MATDSTGQSVDLKFNRAYTVYNPAPQQGPPTEILTTIYATTNLDITLSASDPIELKTVDTNTDISFDIASLDEIADS